MKGGSGLSSVPSGKMSKLRSHWAHLLCILAVLAKSLRVLMGIDI